MITQEIIEYIKITKSQGQDLAQIRTALSQNGWVDQDITEAIVQSGVMTQEQTGAPELHNKEQESPSQTQEFPVATFAQQGHEPHDKKLTKYILALSIAFGIILLGGGGVFAYFTLFTSSNNPVLYEAFANQLSVHTMKTQSTLTASLEGDAALKNVPASLQPPIKITLFNSLSLDLSDASNTKISSQDTLNTTSAKQKTSLEFNIREINNVLYFEVTKVQPEVALMSPSIAEYLNKWFKIDFGNIDKLTTGIQSLQKLSPNNIEIKKQKAALIRTNNDLGNLFTKSKVLVVSKKLDDESIGSVNSYHYQLAIDKTAADKFLASAIQIIEKNNPSTSYTSTSTTQVKKLFDEVVTLLNNSDTSDMEIWVSKDKHLITKILFKMTFTKKTLSKLYSSIQNTTSTTQPYSYSESFPMPTGDIFKLSFNSVFSDQNVPVYITAPSQSTSFANIMSLFFVQSLGISRQKAMDAAVKSNLAMIRTLGALDYSENNNIYGSLRAVATGVPSYNWIITDNSGTPLFGTTAHTPNGDKAAANSLTDTYSNAKNHNVKYSATKNTFFVAAELSDGTYWCVDSNGYSGLASTMPTAVNSTCN